MNRKRRNFSWWNLFLRMLNIWFSFINLSVIKETWFFIVLQIYIWRSSLRYLFRIKFNFKHLFKVAKIFFDKNRCMILVYCVIRIVTWFVSVNLNKKYRIKSTHFILIFNDKENWRKKILYYSEKLLFLLPVIFHQNSVSKIFHLLGLQSSSCIVTFRPWSVERKQIFLVILILWIKSLMIFWTFQSFYYQIKNKIGNCFFSWEGINDSFEKKIIIDRNNLFILN
jgi:hypothetical protein